MFNFLNKQSSQEILENKFGAYAPQPEDASVAPTNPAVETADVNRGLEHPQWDIEAVRNDLADSALGHTIEVTTAAEDEQSQLVGVGVNHE